MSTLRANTSSRTVMNSIALLMVVAFAWQAYAGAVEAGDGTRGEGTSARQTSRAIVERSQRVVYRKVERQREVPAAARLGWRVRESEPADGSWALRGGSGVRLLCERLLNLPPPGVI